MKYLIAGLGNVGAEYEHTRHNIGFDIVDHLAKSNGAMWKLDSQAYIQQVLGGVDYPRLRIGIGNKFHKNQQVDFVLGKWNADEKDLLKTTIEKAANACLSFAAIGLKFTMNQFNGKG
ncbi:MAG: hypothetical protein IPP37_20295 [Saprospiraceae bacterium]|nr:hypothetical protein [Saprospiraceae bacterium]